MRIFLYKQMRFEDPGEEFSDEDVRDILARTYPELAEGDIKRKAVKDGTTEVRLEPRPKRNGCASAETLGAQLADRLADLPALPQSRVLDEMPSMPELPAGQMSMAALHTLLSDWYQVGRFVNDRSTGIPASTASRLVRLWMLPPIPAPALVIGM